MNWKWNVLGSFWTILLIFDILYEQFKRPYIDVDSGFKYFTNSQELTALGNAPRCTFQQRQRQIRETCLSSPPARRNVVFGNGLFTKQMEGKGPYIAIALLHHEQKALGCLISKVASTSFLQYVKRKIPSNKRLNRELGITLDDINGKYANYTKYIIVKHPLQRLVSAYYETVKRRKWYNNITFNVFMEKLVSGEFLDKDEHWSLYSSYCYPCDVKYDYVLKMETLDDDLPAFNKFMAINDESSLPEENKNQFYHTHVNNSYQDIFYKYDAYLRTISHEYPVLFKKVLKLYQKDMDMFGYTWSKKNSSCGYNKSDCC